MAGQEFKATEKTVLKHSRDGVVEKNLVDSSEKRVSKRTEEAVLKAETPSDLRFDKLQEAGIASPEPTKRKFSNLQFGRNNPDNKWEEQRAEAKAEMSEQNLQPSEQISPSHKPRPPEQTSQTADYEFTSHSSEQYSTSDETVSVSADEFKDYGEDFNFKEGQPTDERSKDDLSLEKEEKQSKLKEKKERNTLQEHSSAAEKLTDDNGESALNFEGEAQAEAEPIADKKTRKLEKKIEKAEKRLSKLEEKNDKKLPKLVKKDEKQLSKLDKRITKAESKLPQHRVLHVRKEYNPKKYKMQRKLRFEKEAKPLNSGGIVTKGIKKANSMVALSVSGAVHKEIGKYEEDNQTLKAAHGTEKVAESALHFTKESVKTHQQRLKEKPHEKVSKLKFQRETTAQKLNEHKAMTNNKMLRKDEKSARKTLKKSQQKLQRHNTQKKAAQTVGTKAKKAAEKAGTSIVKAIANNKVVIIIVAVILAVFCIFGILGSTICSSITDTGTMIIASSYTSDNEDIYAANGYMNTLEGQLNDQITNIPNVYVGWNEYNYDIDPIQHDPYALTSYLTAMNINFEYDAQTQALIQELFNELYTLEVESVHEVRSYQYTTIDENGDEVLVTVYYDYYILNVTLTANDWDSVVKPKLETTEVYDVYLLLQENKGNKPDLF